MPKFIYLVGHNLIQPRNAEQTRAYIELANRDDNMQALKQVVKSVKDGADLQTALAPYTAPPALSAPEITEEAPKKHVDGAYTQSRAGHAARILRGKNLSE